MPLDADELVLQSNGDPFFSHQTLPFGASNAVNERE